MIKTLGDWVFIAFLWVFGLSILSSLLFEQRIFTQIAVAMAAIIFVVGVPMFVYSGCLAYKRHGLIESLLHWLVAAIAAIAVYFMVLAIFDK